MGLLVRCNALDGSPCARRQASGCEVGIAEFGKSAREERDVDKLQCQSLQAVDNLVKALNGSKKKGGAYEVKNHAVARSWGCHRLAFLEQRLESCIAWCNEARAEAARMA